jgi:hypothetical protein
VTPLRFHVLRTLGQQSPAHAKRVLDGGEDGPSAPMELGTATHALILGTKRVMSYPGAVRRGKEWEAFQIDHADALILNKSDNERAHRMAEAVAGYRHAHDLMSGQPEQQILWSLNGRECRSTPDSYSPVWVADLKTTRSSEPGWFSRCAIRAHYHTQLAWYRMALIASGFARPCEAYIVAVESTAPYPVTVFRLTQRAMEAGERQIHAWFERFRACEESQQWPPYAQSAVDLDLPEDDELQLTFGAEALEIALDSR